LACGIELAKHADLEIPMSHATETPFLPEKSSFGTNPDVRPDFQAASSQGRRVGNNPVARALEKFVSRIRQFKEERPFQLLAAIAGTAFALGVAVRIWRGRV
jgi:hypothetical protein